MSEQLNLKIGDKAVKVSGGFGFTQKYEIVTVTRETKTQLEINGNQKFNKKDGIEATAYSAWRERDRLVELTIETQARVDGYAQDLYKRTLIKEIEGFRFVKLSTTELEAIKKIIAPYK